MFGGGFALAATAAVVVLMMVPMLPSLLAEDGVDVVVAAAAVVVVALAAPVTAVAALVEIWVVTVGMVVAFLVSSTNNGFVVSELEAIITAGLPPLVVPLWTVTAKAAVMAFDDAKAIIPAVVVSVVVVVVVDGGCG
jgi:hypothetical protein